MAWNKPNDHESELDPWGKKKSDDKYDGIQNTDENQSIKTKNKVDMKTLLFKIRHSIINTNNSSNISKKMDNPFFIVFLISFFIWCSYGFYIIKENERGVVTTFGKFNKLAEPGLNWRPVFINNVNIVNVSRIYESNTSSVTLTRDEDIVRVIMSVQYKIINPVDYLFSVSDPENSLQQAIDSSMRGIIGNENINQIVNEEQNSVNNKIEKKIEEIIKPYKIGIKILDVNVQTIEMPKEVQSSFNDIIKHRSNGDQYIRETEMYLKDIESDTRKQAKHILELARFNAFHIVSAAESEIAYFSKMLSEYHMDKKNTFKRLYLESMEKRLRRTQNILINQKNIPVLFLFLDKHLNNNKIIERLINNNKNFYLFDVIFSKNNKKQYYFSPLSPNNTLRHRRINTLRSDIENLEK